MDFSGYLREEWKPALGCTEPASIALAAATAAHQAGGTVRAVRLVCDPRIYKNCYAVGIPHSGHKVGIRWALAIGALLPEPERGLECFRAIDARVLAQAGALLAGGAVDVEVDRRRQCLYIDCRVVTTAGVGRAVIEGEHTRLVRVERDGQPVAEAPASPGERRTSVREELAGLGFDELIRTCRSISAADRRSLRHGAGLNLAIANHGLTLFPPSFVAQYAQDSLSRISRLVCAGVYARMWGEDFVVMSLAGSGNKGITCSVPLLLWGEERGLAAGIVEEALALACLVTSLTTHHLGTLSAVCGCSNAAGLGLAAALVYLQGGGEREISLAVNNMVGNVTGMICDGAKIGCALKTMTSVDAAFRAASLAREGIGIPVSDGIVGHGSAESLVNLGRIATRGLRATDDEILDIMQEKLRGQ